MLDPAFMIRKGEKGLGLATAYSIIHRHDGYITAEWKPDHGTIIHVYLPASEKEVVETKYLEGKFPVGKGKILLMDDEETIRDAVGRVLQSLGYEVNLAQNAHEALELYQKSMQHGERFDVVIMDLASSNKMRLEETIKKLLEINPEAKVVLSSGYPNDPIMLNYKEYGFSDVIAKPYQVEELSKTLYKVIMGS
jgi:CheY-like chemotaxis protein